MSTYEEQDNPGAAAPEASSPGAATAPPPPYAGPTGTRWSGVSTAFTARRKSPALACVLSFLMPGLGQIYLGYYQRGFLHAIVFATTIAMLASNAASGLEPLFGIFLGFWYLYNIVDAGRSASLYNMAIEGLRQPELPKDFKMPRGPSSLFAGLVLTGLGLVLFLHQRFDMSLEWLIDWWPMILVAFGLSMVYGALKRRS